MNTAILITIKNAPAIVEFCKAAAILQKEPVNGAFVVISEGPVPAEIDAFASKFKVKLGFRKVVPGLFSNDGKNSALMAEFINRSYAMYPGGWLIVDGPALPRGENFVDEVKRVHLLGGKACSGIGIVEAAGPLAIGPMVIGLKLTQISSIQGYGNSAWRSKARYSIARAGLSLVKQDQWPIFVPGFTDPALKDETPLPMELPEPKEARVLAEIPAAEAPPVKISVGASGYDRFTDTQLKDQIETITGRYPHPKTGRQKLISTLESFKS